MADASTCETCGRPVLDPKGCDYDRLIIHGPACICADCRHWCRAPRLPCLPVDWHYRAIAAEARAEAAEAERDRLSSFHDDEKGWRVSAEAELATARELVAVLEERAEALSAETMDLFERAKALDGRRVEGRMLLARMVKYCREDRATTERATRLERLVEQVADYLNRTHDPADILRGDDGKAGVA